MSNAKPSSIDVINDKFFELSLREKMLILLAGIFLLLLIGYVSFIEPALKKADLTQKQIARQQAMAEQLDLQIAQLNGELKKDPNIPLRERLDDISANIAQLDLTLSQQTADLVPAERMPTLLEEVLARTDNLTLIEMKSIPPQRLVDPDSPSASDPELAQINLFQHGVSLTLKGEYFDVQRYLEQVEQLPWRFYWKTFAYQVDSHPEAQVVIELYTLSTSSAFIGVDKDD